MVSTPPFGSSFQTEPKDWLEFGSDNFFFEVIDTIEKSDDPNHNHLTDLTELLNVWLDEYEPYGDRGYNKKAMSP